MLYRSHVVFLPLYCSYFRSVVLHFHLIFGRVSSVLTCTKSFSASRFPFMLSTLVFLCFSVYILSSHVCIYPTVGRKSFSFCRSYSSFVCVTPCPCLTRAAVSCHWFRCSLWIANKKSSSIYVPRIAFSNFTSPN